MKHLLKELKKEAVKAVKLRGHKFLGSWRDTGAVANKSALAMCLKCRKEVQVDSAPAPNGIEIGGEAVALNCIGIEPDRVADLLDATGTENETKKEHMERLLREETGITEYAESIGIEPENLAALLDQELERFNAQVEAEIRRHREEIEKGDKTELPEPKKIELESVNTAKMDTHVRPKPEPEKITTPRPQPNYSADLVAEYWDETPQISIHDFKSRFLTKEQQRKFGEDVLSKKSPHWDQFEMKFTTGELFEMAGLIPFKVKYSETRSYSLMVAGVNEDEARELADAKIYQSKNHSAWSYSDEEFDITDTRLSYKVVVGNIGQTYSGKSFKEAWTTFDEYVKQSKGCSSRAMGEDVSLFRDGELIREFIGNELLNTDV